MARRPAVTLLATVLLLAATPARGGEQGRVLVLPFRASAGLADAGELLTAEGARLLASQEGYSVLTVAEATALTELAALKQQFGQEARELQAVQQKLDAHFVVGGRLGKLGAQHMLLVFLYGKDRATVLNRQTLRDTSLDRIADGLGPALAKLMRPFRPAAPLEAVARLDKKSITAVITGQRGLIRACYDHALQSDPTLQGSLTLGFTITPDGSTEKVAVLAEGSTLESDAVRACIEGTARAWIFPKPPGGGTITVKYPFKFRH